MENKTRVGHPKISYKMVRKIKELIIEHDVHTVSELAELSNTYPELPIYKFYRIHVILGYFGEDEQFALLPTRHLCKRFSTLFRKAYVL